MPLRGFQKVRCRSVVNFGKTFFQCQCQHVIKLMTWIDVGQFQADWAIRVDALSIVMMAVITSVSGLVHLYSWGSAPDPVVFFVRRNWLTEER